MRRWPTHGRLLWRLELSHRITPTYGLFRVNGSVNMWSARDQRRLPLIPTRIQGSGVFLTACPVHHSFVPTPTLDRGTSA